MKRRSLPLVVLAIAAAAAAGSAACGGCDKTEGSSPAEPSAAPAETTAPAASSVAAPRRGPMRGAPGAAGPFFAAARSLGLSAEQTTKLDAAEAMLASDEGPRDDEAKALHADLAAGTKAGQLDRTKIDADLAAIDRAAAARHAKQAAALNALHAALEPAQRAATAGKIRERRAQQDQRFGLGGGPKLADRMTKDLELSPDQKKKVEAVAAKAEDPRARANERSDALLAAFEKDDFDATKLAALDPKEARASAEEEVALVEALLPSLGPEQREKLAANIERRAIGPALRNLRRGGHGRREGDAPPAK